MSRIPEIETMLYAADTQPELVVGVFTEAIQRRRAKRPLDDILHIITSEFAVADIMQYVIVLGIAAAHYLPGEMLWVRIIGASRAGKTELLRCLTGHPDVAEMEMLTPASIRGGLEGGKKILDRIDGKLVVMKDMAALLGSRKDDRTAVFALFRNVKDGSLVSDYGTGEGVVYQKASFDWICGIADGGFTQARALQDLLGARFIDLDWVSAERLKATRKARQNNSRLSEVRKRLKETVHALLDTAKAADIGELPQADAEQIEVLADLAAWARSPVVRGQGGEVLHVPKPELGTDMVQGFERIAKGLRLIGVSDPVPCIARLARDSIPTGRREVLLSGATSVAAASNKTGLPERTVARHLADLRLLGVLTQNHSPNPDVADAIRLLRATKVTTPILPI